MISIERFNQLKDKMESLQREANRAEGALEQLKETLETKFDCRTTKEGERFLKELEAEAEGMEKKLDRDITKFEEGFNEQVS